MRQELCIRRCGYLGGSGCTLQDTIEEIERGEDEDEEDEEDDNA
ncbi:MULTISPECIES: hypothetical protein [Ralstonia solanacearum species complex]|nr:hypothetical protein [Ralstonia solanacearum]CCF97567.1 hypothetical protein RSK60_2220001 [Ralstonia solanacearum K60]